jgi:hypothetical protein
MAKTNKELLQEILELKRSLKLSEASNERLNGEIKALCATNDDLEGVNITLTALIDSDSKPIELSEPNESGLVSDIEWHFESKRDQVLLALLPSIRLDYAKTDAEKAAKSANDVMKAFGWSHE